MRNNYELRYDPIKANTALTPQDHMKILGFDIIGIRSDGKDWWFTVKIWLIRYRRFWKGEYKK